MYIAHSHDFYFLPLRRLLEKSITIDLGIVVVRLQVMYFNTDSYKVNYRSDYNFCLVEGKSVRKECISSTVCELVDNLNIFAAQSAIVIEDGKESAFI